MAERSKTSGMTRRSFLLAGAASVTGLSLTFCKLREAPERAPAPILQGKSAVTYGDWRDLYREQWHWDRVVRGTHTSANCVSACAWNLYVRDGIVWREEQSAPYAASNDSVPDWNPRGCQKGACYSDLSTGPSRVSHPMRRVGPRGSGQFKRISWDEALDELAENLVDVLGKRGGAGAIFELGGNFDFGPTYSSLLRFARQSGIPVTDSTAYVGDLSAGSTITLGDSLAGGSSDDWFRSDYVVVWGFNPAVTRIPDAHYLNEARYRGGKVVVIAPDYNPSAVHSDLWVPIRPGTDGAFALAACHTVIEEGLVEEDYLREQTDMPFLVHTDTGHFLRESDMKDDGSDELFAVWDENNDELVWAPGSFGSKEKTLTFPEGVRPALEVSTEIDMAPEGRTSFRSVYSLMRERLAKFTPEIVAEITGVGAGMIRSFAKHFAEADSALILSSYGMCKNYHSDLTQRAQILLASLTGNLGKAGGGWRAGSYVPLDAMGLLAMQDKLDIPHLVWLGVESARNPKEVIDRFMSIYVSSSLFHAVHGGLAEIQTDPAYGDPMLPEGAMPYLEEAIDKGHFPIGPARDDDPPDILMSVCGNVLRHSRMGNRLRDGLFARARFVVDITFRISETGRHADLLLPAAGWYEKFGLKYIVALAPYAHLAEPAVAPLGESKPEWEIFALIAERVAAEAKRRGIQSVKGFQGNDCDIENLFARYTDDGRFGPKDEEKVTEFMLAVSAQTRGSKIEDFRREGGAIRVKTLGQDNGPGMHTEYKIDEPIVPLTDNFEKKMPYPTLTGRQQFYIDHPWFLKLDEALPTFKEPPAAGGNHPFTMTGGHTRWSIHAIWRDHRLMLQLQRGEPIVFVNEKDARERNVADHDWIRIWNDLGEFEARAKTTGVIRPNQVHIYHAWEPYQFRSKETHQALSPSPMKITQLVGDYGHLFWALGRYDPNGVDRETRVDFQKS